MGILLLKGTYSFFEGKIWRGAACVLAGQQAVGVPGAGRMWVGGGVGARWAHGRWHVAVVVEQWAVTRVWRCRLRGGRVGPTQQRCGPPVDGFIRPDTVR